MTGAHPNLRYMTMGVTLFLYAIGRGNDRDKKRNEREKVCRFFLYVCMYICISTSEVSSIET